MYLRSWSVALSSLVVEIPTGGCTCCSSRWTLPWIFHHMISQQANVNYWIPLYSETRNERPAHKHLLQGLEISSWFIPPSGCRMKSVINAENSNLRISNGGLISQICCMFSVLNFTFYTTGQLPNVKYKLWSRKFTAQNIRTPDERPFLLKDDLIAGFIVWPLWQYLTNLWYWKKPDNVLIQNLSSFQLPYDCYVWIV